MKGTRRDVLFQIRSWLDDKDNPVFWLNGPAGTGKSAIAQTVAEMSFEDGRLGASFFCSRDFEDWSNSQKIFPTLALQLAQRYPAFRKELLLALKYDPFRRSLIGEAEKLIFRPLGATNISTLIIIDALDECEDEEPTSAILSILSRFADRMPRVKFFITGRPVPRIRSGFRLAGLRPITEVLGLHDVEQPLVDADIQLFFRARLTEMAKNRSHLDVTGSWPRLSDISVLCEKAAGFFMYASMVVKFVASPYHLPQERLALLVSLPQNTTYEGVAGLDSFYTETLKHVFHDVGPGVPKVDHYFRSIIGIALLPFYKLSIKSLLHLLPNLSKHHILTVLHSLHSLLHVPEGAEGPIQVLHKSFPDFLMDPKRCQDMRFFVNPAVQHMEISLSCLNLMEKGLMKNICDLDDHADLRYVYDLSERREECIGDALTYACKFWTKHLVNSLSSGPDAQRVQNAIDKFFTTHLLFWIEVLIVTANLDISVHSINDIQQWYALVSEICFFFLRSLLIY